MYLALIADVIDSKIVQERFDLQKQLEKTLQKINELFKDCLASAFTLTLGDEFQALLKVEAPVFQIIDTLTFRTKTDSTSFRHWPRGDCNGYRSPAKYRCRWTSILECTRSY